MKYYRCGADKGLCEGARTAEVQTEREWICRSDNPDCVALREEVSWFSVHKKKIIAAGATLLIGISVWAILASLRTDPFRKELGALEADATPLTSRLSSLESTPRKVSSQEESTQRLRDLVARSQSASARVFSALKEGNKDAAAKELENLTNAVKAAEEIRTVARQPITSNAAIVVEARKLMGDFKKLEESADNLRDRASKANRTSVVSDCESLIDELRRGYGKAGRITRIKDAAIDETTVAELAKSVNGYAATAKAAVDSYVAAPRAPFEPKEATLKISAGTDLATMLVLPLLRARSKGEAVGPVEGRWYYTVGTDKILIQSGNAPFQDLLHGQADLVITETAPTPDEVRAFSDTYPAASVESRAYADVICMDALTLVVDPASPLVAITPERLRATATRIGGAAGTPERTVAERFNVVITQETAQRPADAVLGQPDKIGVGLYHNEGSNIKARRLEFQAADGARSLKPSPFSIATEDYKFAYRILAFNRPKASPSAVDLVHFATSPKGQSVIADQGFVDLRLRPSPETDAPPLVLAALGEALHVKNIKSATRLSTNFRYASGADKFDIKALADLERVPEELARDYPNAKLVILGFTDSTGGSQINIPLSQKRAEGVAAALGKAKVVAKTAGLGDQLPVDSNETEDGKARNRRSEIWVVTLP